MGLDPDERCPTPDKQQFAGKRAAKVQVNTRSGYWRAYRCPCGEHWHLTRSSKRRQSAR